MAQRGDADQPQEEEEEEIFASAGGSPEVGGGPLLCGCGSAFRLMSGLREQDMEFDRIVGAIEDVLMDPSFVQLQSGFCDAHCSKTPNPELFSLRSPTERTQVISRLRTRTS